MNNTDFLIDRDYRLIEKLKEVSKHLHILIMSGKAKGEIRFGIESSIQLLDEIIKIETADLKPTTIRLKDAINQALIENEHGDGVLLWILKNKDAKKEKCSLVKLYLNGNS